MRKFTASQAIGDKRTVYLGRYVSSDGHLSLNQGDLDLKDCQSQVGIRVFWPIGEMRITCFAVGELTQS